MCPWLVGGSIIIFVLCFFISFFPFSFLPSNVERDLTWLKFVFWGVRWGGTVLGLELRLEHHTIHRFHLPCACCCCSRGLGNWANGFASYIYRAVRESSHPSPKTWGVRQVGKGRNEKKKKRKGNTLENGAFSPCGPIGCRGMIRFTAAWGYIDTSAGPSLLCEQCLW